MRMLRLPPFPPENETQAALWQLLAIFWMIVICLGVLVFTVIYPVVSTNWSTPAPCPTHSPR